MKKIVFILMTAILLAGGAVAVMSAPSYAQDDEYPPSPSDPYAAPWVGPDTPWVYYNGDWFLNGVLYYFFGPEYGWGPYYAYSPGYIVRPETWYAPRWLTWYNARPQYWGNFHRQYPYWREHRQGQRYDQKFYEQHHGGQGGGWQKGFKGGPAAASRPEGRKPGPAQVAPPERKQPAVQHEQQFQQHQQQKPQPQPQQLRQQQKPQHEGEAKGKEKPKGQQQ
jgi:hypothetical protein